MSDVARTRVGRLPALEVGERADSTAVPRVPLAGVPVLPMPEHVVDAVRAVAGQPFPRTSRGSPALRSALATHLHELDLDVDPDRELLITHGAQHGMSVAVRALLEPGCEVLVPSPTYFFDGTLRLAGVRPVTVPTRARDGWAIDPDALAAAVTPRTSAIVLCNPNNPTGHTPDRAELVAVLDLAARHDLIVFSDESYERYVHDPPGYLPLQRLRDRWPRVVTVTSLSKNHAFTHWRVGYVHAPAELLDAVHAAFEWDAVNVGDIPQEAARAVVEGPRDWLDAVFSGFRARRDLLVETLRGLDVAVVTPAAGIFAFADLSAFGTGGRDLEDALLGQGVVAVAGDSFGGAGDHARFLYGGPEHGIRELGDRLSRLLAGAPVR